MQKKISIWVLILFFCFSMPAMAFLDYQQDEPEIKICAKEIELKSKLKNRYSAYEVTVENKSDMILKLVDGSFEGGLTGDDAYLEIRKNADELLKKRVQAWENWGVWTLGGAWALAVLISPFEWYYNVFTNRRIKEESLKYAQTIFFRSNFYPGEKIEKLALFPIDKNFYLRLTFQDVDTGQIYTVTKENADGFSCK